LKAKKIGCLTVEVAAKIGYSERTVLRLATRRAEVVQGARRARLAALDRQRGSLPQAPEEVGHGGKKK
jgi:hypothetical protein